MANDIQQAFASFRESAWRLEVRDTYNIPAEIERAAEFARTGETPVKTRENNGWIATVEDARSRGAYIGRVRLVGRPLTDYTKFEVAAYRDNVYAGEDVRLLDRAHLDGSWDAAPDVWVFDDRLALTMLYDDTGAWLGTEEVDSAPYTNLRRRIVPHAVPWAEYRLMQVPAPRADAVPVTLPDALVSA